MVSDASSKRPTNLITTLIVVTTFDTPARERASPYSVWILGIRVSTYFFTCLPTTKVNRFDEFGCFFNFPIKRSISNLRP